MARLPRFVEYVLMRFPEGTLERIDAVRGPLEDRADLIREAVERELKRREHKAAA